MPRWVKVWGDDRDFERTQPRQFYTGGGWVVNRLVKRIEVSMFYMYCNMYIFVYILYIIYIYNYIYVQYTYVYIYIYIYIDNGEHIAMPS